jgi:hypothetical protein
MNHEFNKDAGAFSTYDAKASKPKITSRTKRNLSSKISYYKSEDRVSRTSLNKTSPLELIGKI